MEPANENEVDSALCAAIVDAFTPDELARLVQFQLAVRLGKIVAHNVDEGQVAFALAMWARRMGRTTQLIKALLAERPRNRKVAALRRFLEPGAAEIGENPEVAALRPLVEPGAAEIGGIAAIFGVLVWLMSWCLSSIPRLCPDLFR